LDKKEEIQLVGFLPFHYSTLFLKFMMLYGEFVAKNETKTKMEIPQNLQNPATINMTVIFAQKISESMH